MATATAEDVQVIQFQKDLNREARSSSALACTIAQTRLHPDLLGWFRHPGEDTAHDEIVRQWGEQAVKLGRPRSRDAEKELAKLLSAAKRFLEEEDERLAAVYAFVTSRPEWAALPRSARHVYDALHAVARTEGRLGGPSVAQSHRMLLAVMEARGNPYKSLATVTKARVELVRHGFIDAEAGKPWSESDGQTISTIYHLLPPYLGLSDHGSARSELALSARIGLVHFCSSRGGVKKGVKDARPAPLSPAERSMLEELKAERRRAKNRVRDEAGAAREEKAAEAVEQAFAAASDWRLAADVGRLLAWDEPGDRMHLYGASAGQGMDGSGAGGEPGAGHRRVALTHRGRPRSGPEPAPAGGADPEPGSGPLSSRQAHAGSGPGPQGL